MKNLPQMNNRTESLLKLYNPSLAIVVYTTPKQEYYLESHAVDEKGMLLEGKPLKQETINDMVDFFFNERKNRSEVTGVFPANMLSFEPLPGGKYTIIWYREAEARMLHFSKNLHIPSDIAWAPSLLYIASGDSLWIYALDSPARPVPGAQLYQAPFHNVGTDGRVCLGSAAVKKPERPTYENIIKYWEDMFWLSEFTHLAGTFNPTKSNLNLLWKEQIETKRHFPIAELIANPGKKFMA